MTSDPAPPIPNRSPGTQPKSANTKKRKRSSRDEVFKTDQLAESIFLKLPMRDILVSVQRVSRRWQEIVSTSDRIQQALFFEPINRSITFVKCQRDIYAETSVKSLEEALKTPLGSSPCLPRLMAEASVTSPTPATAAHARSISDSSGMTTPNTSFESTASDERTKPSSGTSSPTGILSKIRRRPTRLKSDLSKPVALSKPAEGSESFMDLSSPTSPVTPTESRRSSDKWVYRSYPVDDARDLRQQIYEHPLVSRNDAPLRKYILYRINGHPTASWRKQLLTQPPASSVRVIRDNYGNKIDHTVVAGDGIGVRLGEVAEVLKLEKMVFLTFEGREWWRGYEWTKGASKDFLDMVTPGIGEGSWFEVEDGDNSLETIAEIPKEDHEDVALGLAIKMS